MLVRFSSVECKKETTKENHLRLQTTSEISKPQTVFRKTRESPTITLAQTAAFSALIALGTLLSNVLFGFPLPYPLYEITAAPAFYMAIAVLFSRRISFWSIAIGSGVGEAASIFLFGIAPAAFALTYVPGMILARAPEALIINRFRSARTRIIVFSMILATIFESLVFFLIDWPVYTFTSFYCPTNPCQASGLSTGLYLASFDLATMIDVVWIPVALALIVAARRAFRTDFFS